MTLTEFINMLNASDASLRQNVSDVTFMIDQLVNGAKYIPLSSISKLSVQNIEDFLRKYRVQTRGDKLSSIVAMQSLPTKGAFL